MVLFYAIRGVLKITITDCKGDGGQSSLLLITMGGGGQKGAKF